MKAGKGKYAPRVRFAEIEYTQWDMDAWGRAHGGFPNIGRIEFFIMPDQKIFGAALLNQDGSITIIPIQGTDDGGGGGR